MTTFSLCSFQSTFLTALCRHRAALRQNCADSNHLCHVLLSSLCHLVFCSIRRDRISAERFKDVRHLALCCFEGAQHLVHGIANQSAYEQNGSFLYSIVPCLQGTL